LNEFSKNAYNDYKELLAKIEETALLNLDFINENNINNKFNFVFFDGLKDMANIFSNKTDEIKNKYRDIMNSNKNKLKSEILVQDKFLEYNDNIDNITKKIDKNIINADEFIAGN
jgi:hypothetical protein